MERFSEVIWKDGGTGSLPPLRLEWLVPNGLGGYAAGTIAGAPTRRYHALLVAALPNPLGRVVMLNALREELWLPDGSAVRLDGLPVPRDAAEQRAFLSEFRLELGLPVWHYHFRDGSVERRVLMPHGRNTVHVTYRFSGVPAGARVRIHPALHWREQEMPVTPQEDIHYSLHWSQGHLEITSGSRFPPLRLWISAARAQFTIDPRTLDQILYPVEEERGYPSSGSFWSPGCYMAEVQDGTEITLVASTEDWPVLLALSPAEAAAAERERRTTLLARSDPSCRSWPWTRLVLAADAFIVSPGYRLHEVERTRAAGGDLRTIIAGYHWFTDWGRDTMISLEGLALRTGRFAEARSILRTFARYVKDGLIPNMFPVGSNEGAYNAADATLWLFHAVARYTEITGDRTLLAELLPSLLSIIDRHLAGTSFGIHADPDDLLLVQGAEGTPLTWMDAAFDGCVVTPRRGKAVEINALWYNALRLMEQWAGGEDAPKYAKLAARVQDSFNRRFWYEAGGYLFDVIDGEDGDDARFRPNQIFAISLPHPVLRPERWVAVVEAVRERLLTPYGLRSLAPEEPDYHRTYHGDRRSRDSAYHQGTVWPWLIGPFIDAWLRVYPDQRTTAASFLAGLLEHLDDFGVGSIAEVFDAEPPYTPRGCVAQAWSVAEVLRARVVTLAR